MSPQDSKERRPITIEDVESELNSLERLANALSGQDDFTRALIQNQQMLLRMMYEQQQGALPGETTRTGEIIQAVPIRAVGTANEKINENDSGRATFQVRGTVFRTTINAEEDIAPGDTIEIVGPNNAVKRVPSTPDTVSVQVAGALNLTNNQYFVTESPVSVDSTKEASTSWDFVADTVAVYGFDQPIYIAFNDNNDNNRLIPLAVDDDPFNISINTDTIWYRLQSAGTATDLNIVALK